MKQNKPNTYISVETSEKYFAATTNLLLRRLKIVFPIAIFLQMLYNLLDVVIYPEFSSLFLKIRLASCIFCSILTAILFIKSFKKYTIYILDIMAVALGLSLSAMAYLTDGSQSPYFSGVNLVILGFAAVNTFYYKHNLIVSLAQFLIYNAAMLLSDAPFDLTNFIFSNNFLLATSLFVVLLTKFAGQQHFNAFIHNEDLKVKEHQLSSLYRQAAKLARTDDLTKLYNRRHFFDILKNRVKVSENHGLNFYLVLVDVDHFKELNDTFGHPKGDEILIKVAKTLKDNLRPGDFLGRYGGDEFMIIFDGSNNKSLTKRMTDINNKLQNEEVCDEKTGHTISLTFGASLFSPNQALDEEDIFRRADKQLYKAKESQRGSISID